jgi:hypothetical protein
MAIVPAPPRSFSSLLCRCAGRSHVGISIGWDGHIIRQFVGGGIDVVFFCAGLLRVLTREK